MIRVMALHKARRSPVPSRAARRPNAAAGTLPPGTGRRTYFQVPQSPGGRERPWLPPHKRRGPLGL